MSTRPMASKRRSTPPATRFWRARPRARGAAGVAGRYTGRRYDPESELYYYRARYYWPEIGRFLETDPIGYADQMNLYAYVANNPLNATDPTGMCYVAAAGAAGGAAVADGPLPIGDAIGVGILAGSCVYRGYRMFSAWRAANAAAQAVNAMDMDGDVDEWCQEADGPYDQDDVGKIKGGIGEIPQPGKIDADDLIDAERHDPGDPNGDPNDRENHRQWRSHQDRIDREREILRGVQDRIDG